MIAYVKGVPAYTRADYAVIDVGGVGYKVFMPLSHLGRLPREEKIVTVYTYLHVREDIQALYGFLSTEDLDIFELLLAVSGVGPKAALSILSTLEPSKLALARFARGHQGDFFCARYRQKNGGTHCAGAEKQNRFRFSGCG